MDAVNHTPEVTAYLTRHALKHIVPLKVLSAYPQDAQSYYFSCGTSAGVLLLLPTRVTTYESVRYPETQYVVVPCADSPAVTQQMLAYIPTNSSLIFKFMSEHDRAVIEQIFLLERVTSFLSYTCAGSARFTSAKPVIVSERLDKQLLPLYRQNGYEQQEVEGYFDSGRALSFALYENDQPLSACLAYQNHGAIWEICGLFTLHQARRKGYARTVVETALNTLLTKKRIPRYQMDEKNLASKQLAEDLGLSCFLRTEHYLHRTTK